MTKIQKNSQDSNILNFWIVRDEIETLIVESDLCPRVGVCIDKFEDYLLSIDRCGEGYCEVTGQEWRVTVHDILEDSQDANELLDEWLSALMPSELTPESFEQFCKVVECDPVAAPLPSFDVYAIVEGEQRPMLEELNYLIY